MIVEVFLSLLFVFIFGWQLLHLTPRLGFILCLAFFFHISVIGGVHYWAILQDSTGILFDKSLDVQKYFFTAEELSRDSIFSVTPGDITAVAGGNWHFGYYYLNIICMKLSADPMLLMRLIKVFVFFFAVAVAVRYWQQRYGTSAAMWGALYLLFGWWEIIYHNFRNYRDGLIVSICLLIYILCDRMISSVSLRQMLNVRWGRISFFRSPVFWTRRLGDWIQLAAGRYGLLIICLVVLASLRIYLAVIVVAGIALQMVIEAKIPWWQRVAFIFFTVLASISPVLLKFHDAVRYGKKLFAESALGHSFFELGIRCLQTLFSPVPWQYTQQFLIPSQFMYLMMLAFSLLSVVFLIRPKPWGQILVVVLLTLFLGIMTESSYARKRLPLVPIFASWMVAGISRVTVRQRYNNVSSVLQSKVSKEQLTCVLDDSGSNASLDVDSVTRIS